jgi:hypothetical protein
MYGSTLFLEPGTRMGWGVSVTPRPLFTPRKNPVPIVQEAGWGPGPVWTGKSRPAGIRSPDRPARSQSLYRLSYPAHNFPKCRMKTLLQGFNAQLGREDIFKPTIGNKSLHQDYNDKDARIVNFAVSLMLLRALCSRTETFINTPRPLLMGRLATTLITYW